MRPFDWIGVAILLAVVGSVTHARANLTVLPEEPVAIGSDPQFFIDDYIVDNRWALRYNREFVRRVFHAPVKHPANPLIRGDGGYSTVVYDEEAKLFRMWYQTARPAPEPRTTPEQYVYAIAYAQSRDGIEWERPEVGLFDWPHSPVNNIVIRGPENTRAAEGAVFKAADKDRRGYRYHMVYRVSGAGWNNDGIRLAGSHDGIHWDLENNSLVTRVNSDTVNNVVYDPRTDEYVMFCRAKHLYRLKRANGPEDMIDVGESRNIARMASKKLWNEWEGFPQNILLGDELDAVDRFMYFYGMPTHYYGGVYWGYALRFRFNDHIYPELALSRDGRSFHRLPERPVMLPMGPDGQFDSGMVIPGNGWVDVGNEWWIYYAGFDGTHVSHDRDVGMGLARIRREGFVSLRAPDGGGVVVTRTVLWPGGKLLINANANGSSIKVRLTDAMRKPLDGFDYDQCLAFEGNSVAHEVTWEGKSAESLAGRIIRLEFLMRPGADLFSFRSADAELADQLQAVDGGNVRLPDSSAVTEDGASQTAVRQLVVSPAAGEAAPEPAMPSGRSQQGQSVLSLDFSDSSAGVRDVGLGAARVQQGDRRDPTTAPQPVAEVDEHAMVFDGTQFLRTTHHPQLKLEEGVIRIRYRPDASLGQGNLARHRHLFAIIKSGKIRVGAYLESRTGHLVFYSSSEESPIEFLRSDAPTLSPETWYDVTIRFGNERAQMTINNEIQSSDIPMPGGLRNIDSGSVVLGLFRPTLEGQGYIGMISGFDIIAPTTDE